MPCLKTGFLLGAKPSIGGTVRDGRACYRQCTSCIMPHMWWQVGTIYQVYPRSFQDSLSIFLKFRVYRPWVI
jgi:hypothetical protein